MSSLVEPRKLKGFRDYPPHLVRARNQLLRVIERIAERSGFQPISTPAMEYSEVLLGQAGDETDKQVYRFMDHGEREIALRYDLTVPFARYVAENQSELVFPFRKLQIGTVWRGEKPQKGRYREFMQCDVDIIGVDSLEADVEVLSCLARILHEFDFGKFTMRVNNRALLSALIRTLLPGVSDETKVLIALDKLAKIGKEAVLDLLSQEPGADRKGAQDLLNLLEEKDEFEHTPLDKVTEVISSQPGIAEEMTRFRQTTYLMGALLGTAAKNGRIVADLSIARGLGYYTGLVFETTIDGMEAIGSICSGGRYNDLVSRFTKRGQPGIGGSVGLDRLLAAMEEIGKLPKYSEYPLFIALADEEARGIAFSLAMQLRDNGFQVEVGLTRKLDKQFKYADQRGFPKVIVIGRKEMENGELKIKDMKSGTEESHSPADLISRLLRDRYDSQS